MVKYFCDVCGDEVIRNFVDKRLEEKVGKVSIEVMLGVSLVWNSGVVCGKCLRLILCEALNKVIKDNAKILEVDYE